MAGRYPQGEALDVRPSHDTQDVNPFRAVIGTRDGFLTGEVRIEPPFTPGPEVINIDTGFLGGVDFTHKLTTHRSTILAYEVSAEGISPDQDVAAVNGKPAPVFAAQQLLDQLGRSASEGLFISDY